MSTTPSYKYINKLQGKRILIFGGTSGIGFAVAEASIEHGATVIITGSNPEKLGKTVQRLKTAYPHISDSQVVTQACDLSNADILDANLESLLSTVTQGGQAKLNHVVFTAGDGLRRPTLSEVTVEIARQSEVVRCLAPLILSKHLLNYLENSPDSSFSLTGGVNSTKPMPGWTLGAFRGSGTEGLMRGLAVDMAPIRVNIVSPGAIKTELFANIPEEVSTQWGLKTLPKRLGRPEDTAEAYLYLMKDGFVTGSKIDTNGGWLLI
jgi:NAD(P)-dependent dehydrogenase (short-subunit alcohol dehydrogenase family)